MVQGEKRLFTASGHMTKMQRSRSNIMHLQNSDRGVLDKLGLPLSLSLSLSLSLNPLFVRI